MRAQIPSLAAIVLALFVLTAENRAILRAQDVPPPRDAAPFSDSPDFQTPTSPANPASPTFAPANPAPSNPAPLNPVPLNPPPVTPSAPLSPAAPLSAP